MTFFLGQGSRPMTFFLGQGTLLFSRNCFSPIDLLSSPIDGPPSLPSPLAWASRPAERRRGRPTTLPPCIVSLSTGNQKSAPQNTRKAEIRFPKLEKAKIRFPEFEKAEIRFPKLEKAEIRSPKHEKKNTTLEPEPQRCGFGNQKPQS